MQYLQAIVLGFIQGATEFLPISSSGHLHIIPGLLGWMEHSLMFDVFLHAGTLVGIIIYFWKDIARYVVAFAAGIRSLINKEPVTNDAKFSFYVIIATIPAAILGYLFESRIEQLVTNPKTISYFLLVTAGLLLLAHIVKGDRKLTNIGWLDAVVVGFAQAVALIPGISRSGSSITAGRLMGLDRETSARFSFLIAIPIMLGGTLYSIAKVISIPEITIQFGPSFVGFVVAGVVGWLSLLVFFKIIKSAGFEPFIVYLILLFVFVQFYL
ncbi:MAG TPA: undecaprenyl-diphosphatase UppP [Caldisericia bacterium]|nr:undecaprenyl-diphosphatase UppP [Caldisericia bacterium]HPF49015.1 undecaprenyl-diphosphatase UppP [Caldisericia bacterium]HPI83121.1 undecaprenyl-diphosphatase UppP [Caldisericia bacterium]HPQ92348.1 undecaprenyl-diphosphatase UppP [Caldisericia bacterium]HRV74554.1 undecaprenyl-diphosphatase UppP [Caldisericia bacterium]